MLRRILTLALLMAFGAPFVAPIFAATADPQANLPACCRRQGKHHCTMRMGTPSATPALQAPPCPFYPTAVQQARFDSASLTAPILPLVRIHRNFVPLASARPGAQFVTASAHRKRGPPSRSA